MYVMKKHKGSTLLIFVLVAFIILAILSAVALRIAGQTKKTEIWQMNNKEQMLTELSRSAIQMTAEAVSADISILDDTTIYNPASVKIKDDKTDVATVTITINAGVGNILNITAEAKTSDNQKVKILGSYSRNTHKIVRWLRYEN